MLDVSHVGRLWATEGALFRRVERERNLAIFTQFKFRDVGALLNVNRILLFASGWGPTMLQNLWLQRFINIRGLSGV